MKVIGIKVDYLLGLGFLLKIKDKNIFKKKVGWMSVRVILEGGRLCYPKEQCQRYTPSPVPNKYNK